MVLIHGACVAVSGIGVLLRGKPGSGKSDLLLRLIDRGAALVADDQVEITVENNQLFAAAPAQLRGLLEVRGIGLIRLEAQHRASLGLVADLTDAAVERLPEPACTTIQAVAVPVIQLDPFEASAAAKIGMAVRLFATRPGGEVR